VTLADKGKDGGSIELADKARTAARSFGQPGDGGK
jgi:hypothetical protein